MPSSKFRNNLIIFWTLVIPDVLLLFFSLYLSVYVRYGGGWDSQLWMAHLKAFSFVYVLWLVVFFIHNLFDLRTFRRYTIIFVNLLVAMAVNLFLAIAYFYFQPDLILTPRRFLLIDVSLAFVLILVWHFTVKYFIKQRFTQEVYVLSFGGELGGLAEEIGRHEYLGFKVVGHVNELSLSSVVFLENQGIILPNNLEAKPEVLSKLYELRKLGVSFYSHTLFYEELLRKIYLSKVQETWFLENISYRQKRLYTLIKRLVDIVFGLLGLTVYLVTYPIIAGIIKFSSPGPVLFIQERTGLRGRTFTVYKYRTMTIDNPANTWTSMNDPRITTFGKFLRKSRLDELPQCINVLLGNMSMVGPRPEQPHIVIELQKSIPFYDERHMVKPGITGWAQINDAYAATIDESRVKLQYDLYYIKHRSLLFDLEILLKTIYYVLSWRGR